MDFFCASLGTGEDADGVLELTLSAELCVFGDTDAGEEAEDQSEDESKADTGRNRVIADFASALGVSDFADSHKKLVESVLSSSKVEIGKDSTIVMTETIRLNLFRVVSCLETKCSLLLEGPPGIGKTQVVVLCCRLLGKQFVRLNMSANTTMDMLIGGFMPKPTKDRMCFVYEQGVLLSAIQQGHVVLFDELNLAPLELIADLRQLFDPDSTSFWVAGMSKPVRKHPNFAVFATLNPSNIGGKRHELPAFVKASFVRVVLERLSPEDEQWIAKHHLQELEEAHTDLILAVHRDAAEKAATDASGLRQQPNLRTLLKVRDVIRGCNTNSNIALSDALPMALDLIYTSNLQSTKEQEQQQKYIEAMCVNAGLSAATYPSITAYTDTSTTHQFVDTPASLKQLQKISVAAQSKRVVMVCGNDCSGKTSLVVELARRTGRNLVVLPMTAEMETSVLIGQWVMKTSDSQAKSEFACSALVQAIREGGWVLLDNLHFAPSEVVERLNSLAEPPRGAQRAPSSSAETTRIRADRRQPRSRCRRNSSATTAASSQSTPRRTWPSSPSGPLPSCSSRGARARTPRSQNRQCSGTRSRTQPCSRASPWRLGRCCPATA